MWPEGEEPRRYEWKEGSMIVPPNVWFHQHFNTGTTPARYLAFKAEGVVDSQRAGGAEGVDLAARRRRPDRLRGRVAADPAVVHRSARQARPGIAHGRGLCSGTRRAAGARSAGGHEMKRTLSPVARALVACALAMGGAIVTSAQVKPGATAADVANYAGADRMQKIIAGAKKEGSVSVYTSLQTADIGKLGAAFEKKYGVKVDPVAFGLRGDRQPDHPGSAREPLHR